MMQWSKRKLQVLIVVLTVILIMLSGTAGVMAKYATKETINGTITLTANLGQIGIWETTVIYDAENGFTEGAFEGQGGKNYSYPIIPGQDIPKDTIVRVDKDSNDDGTDDAIVPAYVYLIVDTNITSDAKGIQYTLESHWKPLSEYPGVYVYWDADTGKPIEVSSSMDIKVLVNNYIYVSQNVNNQVTGQVRLNFTATMRQVLDGQTAAEIYGSTHYGAT